MLGIFFFICFEIVFFTASIALNKKLFSKNHEDGRTTVAAIIIVKLLLSSTFLYGLTYFHVLSYLNYITLTLFTATILALFKNSVFQKEKITKFLKSINYNRFFFVSVALYSISTLSISPLIETDSNFATNWLLLYMNDSGNVLEFAWNYSPLWEMNYLPGLIFTHSWLTIMIKNFEVICLIYCILKNAVAKVTNDKTILGIVPLVVMTTPILWLNAPTGFSTVKNDLFYTAGILLIIISMTEFFVAKSWNRNNLLYFITGSIIITVKFSGPILTIFMLFAIAIFSKRNGIKLGQFIKKLNLSYFIFLPIFIVFILTYFYNLVKFGSPIYPVQLSVFGLELPGYFNTHGTRIIEHLGLRETWLGLLGAPVFPYTFAGLLFVPYVVLTPWLIFKTSKRVQKNEITLQDLQVRKYILISFFLIALYFITPFSSGTKEQPVLYLTYQNTLRYVIAPILIFTALALVQFMRLVKNKYLYTSLCLGLVVSNFMTILHINDLLSGLSEMIIATAMLFLSAYLSIEGRKKRSKNRIIVVSSILFFGLLFNSYANVKLYNESFYSLSKLEVKGQIATALITLPPQPDLSFKLSGYCATGSNFPNMYYIGALDVNDLENLKTPPEFLAFCSFPWQRISEDVISVVSNSISKYGYTLFYSTQNRLLFRKL